VSAAALPVAVSLLSGCRRRDHGLATWREATHMSLVYRIFCRIEMHRWMVQSDPETGATYQLCDRCRRERDTFALADSASGV